MWGAGAEPYAWFREGLATYNQGFCGPYTILELTGFLQEEGLLPSIDELVHSFTKSEHHEIVRYMHAASFVGYLYETYGMNKVRELWDRLLARQKAIGDPVELDLNGAWPTARGKGYGWP